MKVATSFRDPQSVAKLHCDGLLAGALAASPPPFLVGLATGTQLPGGPPGRLLVVRSQRWVEYQPPVTAVNLLRLVAWDLDPDVAWDVASWFHGRLLALAGDADAVSYSYDSGPARGTDPDFDTPMTAFTIRIRMRPAIL